MEGAAVPARGGDGGGRAAALFVRALLDGARGEVPVLIAPAGVTRSYGDVLGLHLPASFPMHGQGSALARRARFAAAAHLAAHVRFGDQRLARGALRPIQIVLVSLFEDARVERLAARELPGLARLWAELHTAQPTDLATFPALCARLSRALLVPSYEDPHPIIRKARTLFFHPHHPLGSAQGSRRLGSLLGNDVGQMRLAFNAKDYVVEPAYRDDHRLLWQEPPPKADDEAAPLEQADVEERVGPRETLAPGTTGATGERPAGRARAATPISTAPDETARARGSATYPEWDYSIGVSRPHWCTVRDLAADAPAAPGDDADIATFVGRGPLARVTNLARQLRAYDLVKHRRAREGDVVDLDAAVGALVDRRAGVAPDTRVYQRTARRRRDLAVLLLLDLSASTADPVREQRVIDLESRAAILLGELLAGTGELFAVHGFSSNGRHQVDYQRFKELDAPWETTTRRRLRDLSPRLSTRMGAAIRHAGRCLAGVHRRGRLILLLTDGEPSDVDAPDPSYLPHDARHAVAEQRRRGLHVFAVGLGSAAAAGVRRIFGESSSCVVDRLSALPDALPRIYARLVR